MQIFTLPRFVTVDGSGTPYAGAKLEFYRAGTSTPENTYSDADLTIANTNPVVADSNGLFGPIFLGTSYNYKAVLKTSADVTVWTQDDIPGGALDGGELAAGSVPTAAIEDEAITLDKMADLAEGSMIVGGASDRPVALALGAGQVPVGNGTGIIGSGVPLPRGYASGCEVTLGTDTAHDINIAEGVVRDSTDTVNITLSAITKQLDATFAEGTDAGGMNDNAAIANSTTYYVFAIAKTDGTADVYADTSSAAVNLPSGFTYFREINQVRTDGSANIKTIMGSEGWPLPPPQEATASGTSIDFDIPTWARRVKVMIRGLTRSAAAGVIVQLGGAGGIKTANYFGALLRILDGSQDVTAMSGGFLITSGTDLSGANFHGKLTLDHMGSNIWSADGGTSRSDGDSLNSFSADADLGEALTTIRLTTIGGTATLAGKASVIYE